MSSFTKNEEFADLPIFPNGEHTSAGLRLLVGDKLQDPMIISAKDIEKLPKIKLTEDFKCLEGWVVRGVLWEGVRVSNVLRLGKKKLVHRARFFLFRSGSFTCQLGRRAAFRKTTILATRMHGRKLTRAHGGPLRLVFKGHKCYESVKSVDSILMIEKPVKASAELIATSRIRRRNT